MRFQFQTGAIRSMDELVYRSPDEKFQFQTSAIRSLNNELCLNYDDESFNSKLVRLEVYKIEIGIFSILLMFQFQTGAIRSSSYSFRLRLSSSGFNSKLVRLEVPNNFFVQILIGGFNSKLVRLEVMIDCIYLGAKLVSIPNWCD